MVAPRPSASSISGARNVTPASAASAIGTRFVGRLAEPHDVEQHVGAAVGAVVEQFLHHQRVDPAEQPRHGQRQHLGRPAGLDAGAVERRPPIGAGRFQPCRRPVSPMLRGVDQAGHAGGHHVLARRQQPADVVDRARRVLLALRHVQHAVGVDGEDRGRGLSLRPHRSRRSRRSRRRRGPPWPRCRPGRRRARGRDGVGRRRPRVGRPSRWPTARHATCRRAYGKDDD